MTGICTMMPFVRSEGKKNDFDGEGTWAASIQRLVPFDQEHGPGGAECLAPAPSRLHRDYQLKYSMLLRLEIASPMSGPLLPFDELNMDPSLCWRR